MSLETTWIDALLDPGQPLPPGLKAWNGSDPAQRFAVYRNNVTVSLIDALGSTFTVTRQLVGEEFFRAMAREFVRRHPPRNPLLAEYGDAFPAFIAGFPPARPLPYLTDIARLEQAYLRAYHAADAEPLEPEQLHTLLADANALAACRLALHPSLHTLQSPCAIVSLWAAHQGKGKVADGDLSGINPEAAENAWVLRNGLRVAVLNMRGGDCHFADALGQGQPLAEAANAAQDADRDFDLTACLAVMLREQLVCAIER